MKHKTYTKKVDNDWIVYINDEPEYKFSSKESAEQYVRILLSIGYK